MDNLKLVFCLPGSHFSKYFVMCWTETIVWAKDQGYSFRSSFSEGNNIYAVRNQCLGGDMQLGKHQKPFHNGEIDYDYLMWIDSDQVWNAVQIQKLIDQSQKLNLDIVSGCYAAEGGKELACGDFTLEKWKNNSMSNHTDATLKEAADENGMVEVGYNGLGFMLVKKGVFEAMTFPWFWGGELINAINSEGIEMQGFSDDAAEWCFNAKKLGFKTYVDTNVRVWHEKKAFF